MNLPFVRGWNGNRISDWGLETLDFWDGETNGMDGNKVNAFLCLPVSLCSPVRLFVVVIDTCTGQIGRLSKNHSAGRIGWTFDCVELCR